MLPQVRIERSCLLIISHTLGTLISNVRSSAARVALKLCPLSIYSESKLSCQRCLKYLISNVSQSMSVYKFSCLILYILVSVYWIWSKNQASNYSHKQNMPALYLYTAYTRFLWPISLYCKYSYMNSQVVIIATKNVHS